MALLLFLSIFTCCYAFNTAFDFDGATTAHNALAERVAQPIQVDLISFENVFFFMNVSIGTPAQTVGVVFDTGSRDPMIIASQSNVCQAGKCTFGSFDSSQSSSFANNASDLIVAYEIETGSGNWSTDSLLLGQTTFPSFEFGLLTNCTTGETFFGVGYPEAPQYKDQPVKTTLRRMADSGVIPSASVSVKLADPPSVIFGGYDSSAFSGDLTILPIVPSPQTGGYDSVAVNLTSVTVAGNTIPSNQFPIRVLFDTGNFDIKLPTNFVNPIWQQYNITGVTVPGSVEGLTYGLTDCGLNSSTDKITFGFAGTSYDLSIGSLVVNVPDALLAEAGLAPGALGGKCVFLINPLANDEDFAYNLGIPFLLNTYLVLDQESHQVGLGKLTSNSGGTPTISGISSGSGLASSVPSSTSSGSASGPSSHKSVAACNTLNLFLAALSCICVMFL